MAKIQQDEVAPVAPVVPVIPEAAEFPQQLDEFCMHLSQSDKRVELIGAFEHAERVAGRMRDTASAYAARYAAFLTLPA